MTSSLPLPQDAMTVPQHGRISGELLRLNPSLPYEGGDDLWVAELNARCNMNIGSMDELTKKEASNIINLLAAQ